MNKKKLIERVATEHNKSIREIEPLVDSVFTTIIESLKDESEVKIVGFGTFRVKSRRKRNGVDPNTGDSITIPETVTPTFTAGKRLSEEVKGKR
jgi:DNA-binding protein HU-beta